MSTKLIDPSGVMCAEASEEIKQQWYVRNHLIHFDGSHRGLFASNLDILTAEMQSRLAVRSITEAVTAGIQSDAQTVAKTVETIQLAARALQEPEDSAIEKVSDALLRRNLEAMTKAFERASAKAAIEMPPGIRMLRCAGALFSKKTIERVFEPIVADYQHEVFEAIKSGRCQAEVRRIQERHWIGFVLAVACQIAGSIGKLVRALKGAG